MFLKNINLKNKFKDHIKGCSDIMTTVTSPVHIRKTWLRERYSKEWETMTQSQHATQGLQHLCFFSQRRRQDLT